MKDTTKEVDTLQKSKGNALLVSNKITHINTLSNDLLSKYGFDGFNQLCEMNETELWSAYNLLEVIADLAKACQSEIEKQVDYLEKVGNEKGC